MRILLIHQNFPGQFRQLTPYLQQQGHDLVAICSHQRPLPEGPGLKVLRYQEPSKPGAALPHGSQLWHEGLERAKAVAKLCRQLDGEGWRPDRIAAHCGWGETLGLRDVWPTTPQILWPELWLRPEHMGWGSDPLVTTAPEDLQLEQLGRNALTRAALSMADAWVLPTQHQANSLPREFQGERLHVIHEGIDTRLARPNPSASYEVRGIQINRDVPTLTFVNRNLERLRGFDTFMRALPAIQRSHSTVRTLIVGDNEAGYGGGDPSGQPLRERMLKELSGDLDLERIHFLGRIPHPMLITLLQSSWVHVYLSYPFILGWSLLEAMACGCCIVGSNGMPVSEVIHNGVDGFLTCIKDPEGIADRTIKLLKNPSLRLRTGIKARQTAELWDQAITLPRLTKLITALHD